MSTAVSLFAGVGGIDLALERAGFRVTTAVELDAAARGVLADRFPNTTLRNDVTEVTADDLRADGFLPRRGLIAAGWPCQGNSVAGRRGGMADPRSGLWRHVVRLLAQTRPTWFLGENVPGLLSVNDGDDFGVVLQDLADLGYGFAWRVLDAQWFGVPQRRRRVVIVGCLGDDRRPVEVLLEPEGGSRDPATGHSSGAELAATLTAGAHGPGVSAPGRRAEDDVNLVVAPTVTAKWAKGTGGPAGDESQNLVVSALTAANGGSDDNMGQAGHLIPFQRVVRSGERDTNGNLPPGVWAEREVAATLSPFDLGSDSRAVELIVHPLAVRGRDGGSQLEVGPEGGPFNALRAGDGGSSRTPLVSITGERTHALTAEGHDASEDGTGRGTPIVGFHLTQDPISGGVMPALGRNDAQTGTPPETGWALRGLRAGRTDGRASRRPQLAEQLARELEAALSELSLEGASVVTTVRRLTPRETERLQGFPDDWTATSNGKPQADSPRYRQMGNAVAVPVFEWVAHRIAASERGAA